MHIDCILNFQKLIIILLNTVIASTRVIDIHVELELTF